MKIKITLLLLLSFSLFTSAQSISKNDSRKKVFIDSLMKQMTVEEKIGQLNLPSVGFDVTGPLLSTDVESKIEKGLVGGVFNTYTPVAVRKLQELAVTKTRLKIPLIFGYDVIHGHRTIFPIPLATSCSWDIPMIGKIARTSAEEASADGLCWTFSPMVDIARDPRWGRVSEGAGEDTYLGSLIAKAMVHGYQGNDYNDSKNIMACVKHFALYGAAEAGRDYNTVDMSEVKMYNDYLPPYKAAVDAGVSTVMSSFNEINGIPSSANKWLMTDLLRKEWGFKGFVATDYTAINEMIQHGMGDGAAVAQLAISAPVEMDMVGELFINELPKLVKEGRVTMKQIDDACRLILEAKYNLGLFKDPYKYVSNPDAAKELMSTDKMAFAKETAMRSMVLLRNNNDLLPLNQNQKIAFIGPFVNDKRNVIGNWSGAGDYKQAISLWEGLVKKFGEGKFLYAKGCNIMDDEPLRKRLNDHDGQIEMDSLTPKQLIDQAIGVAINADLLVVALGETFGMSGEAACRSDIGLLENQKALLHALKHTGKPIVLILMNGRPLTLQWENDNMDAILETWFAGTQTGNAITDVLFGDYNPSAKLTMTFPRNVGQIPIYYNAKNTGRPYDQNNKYTSKYLDVPNSPLYPFGYGLSYTKFEYTDLNISKTKINFSDSITVSVKLTNSGKYDGEEVVQLYVRDMVGSITRPLKELKGFQKVFL
ncbi:MAG: beta-glucosidase BglX, partial [Bacteroidia bacterium]